MATVATAMTALALLFAQGGDQWTPRTLKAGDVHRVELLEESRGTNVLRDPANGKVERVPEDLRRHAVYHQRVLACDDPAATMKYRALCVFDKLESSRESLGKKLANFGLREDMRFLALDPRPSACRAWSPNGPLLWSEVHTVSHLVFVPALNGLLPGDAIKRGDQWRPARATLEHLSTLLPLRSAEVVCECRGPATFQGEQLVQISVSGTLSGDEPELLGPATDELAGGLYIRPDDGSIHSLNLRAKRVVKDSAGREQAQWETVFRLNLRPPARQCPELAEAAAAKYAGAPTAAQLSLIAPYPYAAVDIVHPRDWRPERPDRPELAGSTRFDLTQPLRNERLQLNFELDGKTPTVEEYAARVKADFATAKGVKLLELSDIKGDPQGEPDSPDYKYTGRFIARVRHGGADGTERIHIYLVWRKGARGATAMVHCDPKDLKACYAEAGRIVAGLRFTAASLAADPKAAKAAAGGN